MFTSGDDTELTTSMFSHKAFNMILIAYSTDFGFLGFIQSERFLLFSHLRCLSNMVTSSIGYSLIFIFFKGIIIL